MRIWNTTSETVLQAMGAWLIAALALGAFEVQAQTTGFDAVFGEGADVVLTDAGRFHVTLHSQGAGVGFQRGTFDGAFVVRGWQGELVFVRHLKEEKTRNPVYEEGLPYVFGKVNAFHALRLQRYKESVVAEKYRRGGVTVSHTRSLGAVLGIAKPVFLEIGYPEIPYTSLQVERYVPEEHFSDRIYGRAPWVNGLESLTWNPGCPWGRPSALNSARHARPPEPWTWGCMRTCIGAPWKSWRLWRPGECNSRSCCATLGVHNGRPRDWATHEAEDSFPTFAP